LPFFADPCELSQIKPLDKREKKGIID